MNDKLYYTLVSETFNYEDPDAYVSDLALSSEWGDPEDAPIPEERIETLRNLYMATRRTIKDIAAEAGMSIRQLARHFAIPDCMVDNWSCGSSECPVYTRLLMQESLGLYKR